MIKLKSLLETIYAEDLDFFRNPLSNYLSKTFSKEYDERQLLLFGLTMEELKQTFLDKIFQIKINTHNIDEEPYGVYRGDDSEIDIYYNYHKFNRHNSYKNYVYSMLFHELIHAINFHKKLFDKVTYDGMIFDDSYYGSEEEIRAYTAQIQQFLINTLGMSRSRAVNLMKKYSTDQNSKYRDKWLKTYAGIK